MLKHFYLICVSYISHIRTMMRLNDKCNKTIVNEISVSCIGMPCKMWTTCSESPLIIRTIRAVFGYSTLEEDKQQG